MKRGHYSIGKRILALLLAIFMVAAYLPVISSPVTAISADDITGKITDPATINDWKKLFGPDVMSTEYTGGVWTDKSVFQNLDAYLSEAGIAQLQGPTAAISDPVRQMLATAPENFLIALSAISASRAIKGNATAPMDTIMVLDVSGSMQGDKAVAMVQATNEALDTLLKQNNNNRVGVVLYSGNHNVGNSNTDTGVVILPLGRYTTTGSQTVSENGTTRTIAAYLTVSGSGDSQTVSLHNSVKNQSGAAVSASKTVRGGTYIQNGLYKAWQEFQKVTDTVVPAGNPQEGAQRTPVIILMSDGSPTAATTNYNSVATSGLGDGTATSNHIGFMTQLTASWVRSKVQGHYNTTPKFYTLGVGTGNEEIATSILNPAASSDTLKGYWNNYFTGSTNYWGNVQIVSGNGGWSVYKDAAVTTRDYVDKYWLAENSEDMLAAFKQIVDQIVLEAASYSTLVEEQGEDLSGYITFEDELGVMMEVKSIKGLVVGNRIFTGAELAKSMNEGDLGTVDGATAYGDELIRTVKERLGITETAVAQRLVNSAYAAGQLSYTSATEYSNYIGWYADKDGNYLGFWQESDGYGTEGAPQGAVYINKSYGYLGAESSAEGASDMMHVVVMVHTHIATGDQSVVYKIPASLIPAVHYEVELEGSSVAEPKSITRQDAAPLQLLVEVGLRENVNAVNIHQKVEEYVAAGGHIHKNAEGTYTFYTNQWGDGHGGAVNYDEPFSHLAAQSHFHPAVTNDRYYYTANTLIYADAAGTPYAGSAAPSGSGYYYARNYYAVVNGAAVYTTKYLPVAAVTVEKAVQGTGGWYIPAGTARQDNTWLRTAKADNVTQTLDYSDYPAVLHNADGYNVYSFLGNNGSFTITPAQGIALSKTVTETVPEAQDTFTFQVTLSQPVENPAITDADGKALLGIAQISGNVITLQVKAGQVVYITNIPAGTTYTVQEQESAYYLASSENATGTVAAYTISPVDFTNAPRGYGELIIGKDVVHPYEVEPAAMTQKLFTIQVQLMGVDVANKTYQISGLAGVTSVTTDANGVFTVALRNGESVSLHNLPEGTTYQATEILSATEHKGFTMDETQSVLSGEIVKNETAQVHVVNVYAPSEPVASIAVTGTKTVEDKAGTFDWTGKSFTFQLEQYDPDTGVYTRIAPTVTVAAQGGSYTFENALKLNAIGTYYYKVSEVIPPQDQRLEGMSYDATAGRFLVEVTDNDVNGELEFQIRDYETGTVIDGENNVFTFTKNFVNIHTTDAAYVEFTVDKQITDTHNTDASEAGYLFGLYKVENGVVALNPTYTMRTVLVSGTDGKATFHVPVTEVGQTTYILKEILPEAAQRMPGMIYDTTEYTVVVTAQAENGKLVPSVSFRKNGAEVTQSELVFNNVIDLNPASVQWDVNKVMAGVTPVNAETFRFSLTQTDSSYTHIMEGGVSQVITIAGAGTGSFSPVEYSTVGTRYYVIQELPGTTGGMTYDGSVYHLKVDVTVDGNNLQAATVISKLGSGSVTDITFTNTYAITGTQEVTIDGIKYLQGRELSSGEFTFGLYQGDTRLSTAANLANGKFSFPAITYTAQDIGTHIYTVREDAGSLGGVKYDATVYTVVVKVSDNGQGGLTLTKTVDGAADTAIIFTNTYEASPTSATLSGTKTLEGRQLNSAEFTFELYSANADFSQQGSLLYSKTNDASGKFSFTLGYAKPGDYYYILREQIGQEKGVSYDASRYLIRVLVSDDGAGKLHTITYITKEGVGTASAITFGNRYEPESTTAAISGTKVMTGRQLVDGEFTFELADDNGRLLYTATNAAGSFRFPEITYTAAGTYTYTVTERVPAEAQAGVYKGVTYDKSSYSVTVVVTDQGGQLAAQITYPAQGLVFRNSYQGADTHFTVTGTKVLTGKTLEAGMFTFEMYDKNHVLIATTANEADGSFSFRNIPLSEAGAYTFTVVEKVPAQARSNRLSGIVYSSDIYTVSVNVVDNTQTGKLEASAPVITKGGGNAQLVFRNEYTVDPVTVYLSAGKQLLGRTLKAGEFSFLLTDGAGYTQQAVNTADGIVEFEPITFYAPGEITYTVSEIKGNLGGVSYDGNTYRITVTVTDNGDGTMSAQISYPDGYPGFVNTYTVTGSATFSVSGTKKISGREMTAQDVFTFEMKDAAGNVVATTQNAGGSFRFENVALNTLGVHTFTITEAAPADGDKDGITYSTQSYTVIVEVTDDGKGGMQAGSAKLEYNGAAVVSADFVNTYTAKPAQIALAAKKSYEKTLNGGDFTFLLTGHGENQQKTNDAKGEVHFESIILDKAGTYTFTITEKPGEESWIDYDETVYNVTVQILDDGKGQLYAASTTCTANGAAATDVLFDNDYILKAGSVTIAGSKQLYYKDQAQTLEAGRFSFGLYENGKLIQTAQNDAQGNFSFSVDYEQAGSHTYTVSEIIPDSREEGMVYDTRAYTVQVTVTDDDKGNLLATQELVDAQEILFVNNTYDILVKDVFKAAEPTFSIDGKMVQAGEVLLYTITYTNTNAQAVDVTITDTIPAHTEFVSSETGTYADGVVTWQKQNVAVGQTVRVSFQVRVVDSSATITNQAKVFDGTNRSTNEVTNSVPGKTADRTQAAPGEVITYTITYTNTTGKLANLVITDTLDANLEYVEGTAGTGVYANGTLTWNMENVAADAEVTVTFQARVRAEARDKVPNKAQILENTSNAVFTNDTTVEVKLPALTIEKEQAMNKGTFTKQQLYVKAGTLVTYKIKVTNNGEGAAYGIVVSDKIPQGLQYLEGSANLDGKAEDGVVTWIIGELAPGASVELTFEITVPAVDANTSWTNVATVISHDDPTPKPSNEVVITEEVPVTPETGDSFNMLLFMVMMAISACGMVTVTVLLLKEKKAN